MIRLGMVSLISALRQMTATSSTETTIDSSTYWSDSQLQDALDLNSIDVSNGILVPKGAYVSGSIVYTRYIFSDDVTRWMDYYTQEELSANSNQDIDTYQRFSIADENGYVLPNDSYTISPLRKSVDFNTDQRARTRYVSGTFFDMYQTAYDIWMQKASFRTSLVSWKAGDVSMREDQEYDHCIQMAKHYAGRRGIRSIKMVAKGYNVSELR